MYTDLLPQYLREPIERYDGAQLTEIRIRVDKPVTVRYRGKVERVRMPCGVCYGTRELIDEVLRRATSHSLYSVRDSIANGYIPYSGGVRIGVAGNGILEDGERVLESISSLVIRIPHQLTGIAKKVFGNVIPHENYLIAGRPHSGKTTLIRDMVRLISDSGANCLVVDERGEIAAVADGTATLDVGQNTDVISGVRRADAFKMAVKNMNPDVIVVDETYDREEITAIVEAAGAGVMIIASVHAGSMRQLMDNVHLRPLVEVASGYVLLSADPVGEVLYKGNGDDLVDRR